MKIFPTKNKNPCKRLLQCVYDFRNWTHNFRRALRQVNKQHLEVKLWNWGPATICHTMTCVQFFLYHHTLLCCINKLVTFVTSLLTLFTPGQLVVVSEGQEFLAGEQMANILVYCNTHRRRINI